MSCAGPSAVLLAHGVWPSERGVEAADEVWANLRAQERPGGGQSIRWLEVDEVLVRTAAKIKAGGGISYADSFAAAAAGILGCPVLVLRCQARLRLAAFTARQPSRATGDPR